MSRQWASFARFLATGGLNTGFSYASYAALVLTGLPLWLAVAASLIMSIVFNFYSYGALVFGNSSATAMPRFLAFYLVLGLINFGLLRLLGAWGLGPLLAQALLLPAIAVIGFLGMRTLVFTSAGKKAG